MNTTKLAKSFRDYSVYLELLGENSFKIKAYKNASDILKGLDLEPEELKEKLENSQIKGIGKGLAAEIEQILSTSSFTELEKVKKQFPENILELLEISGLGAKKCKALYEELKVSSIEELEKVCKSEKLRELKGFSANTEKKFLEELELYKSFLGKKLYSEVEYELGLVKAKIAKVDSNAKVDTSGELKELLPIIENAELLVCSEKFAEIAKALELKNQTLELDKNFKIQITNLEPNAFEAQVSKEDEQIKDSLSPSFELKGILHAHSTYSDGKDTLEDLAKAIKSKGFEYLGISDHSKTAAYAGGLNLMQIEKQHREIEKLNRELAPFKIFKGIESDILKDGSLDYDEITLKKFDFIIASVHSSFQISEEEMTKRIIKAIENPYTTILGHPTGRLLLKRKGYQLNIEKILDAAASNHVAIEINANPRRLDLDWQWHKKAKKLGILMPISPDAHSIKQVDFIKYGINLARRGNLTSKDIPTAWPVDEFEEFLKGK